MTPESKQPPTDRPRSVLAEYARAVQSFMRKRIHRPHDADDLAQEVFIRFLRLDSAKLIANPLAYLYGIASHVIYEFRMHAQLEQSQVIYDSTTLEAATETAQESQPRDDVSDRYALQQQLEWALNQLPSRHRAVLLLVKRDGLSHEEVARLTHLNVRTVERYVMQAMTQLRMLQWD